MAHCEISNEIRHGNTPACSCSAELAVASSPRDEREGGRRDGLEAVEPQREPLVVSTSSRTTSRVVRSSLLLAACEVSSPLFSSLLFSSSRSTAMVRLKKLLVLSMLEARSLARDSVFVCGLQSYSAQAARHYGRIKASIVWFLIMRERSRQPFPRSLAANFGGLGGINNAFTRRMPPQAPRCNSTSPTGRSSYPPFLNFRRPSFQGFMVVALPCMEEFLRSCLLGTCLDE